MFFLILSSLMAFGTSHVDCNTTPVFQIALPQEKNPAIVLGNMTRDGEIFLLSSLVEAKDKEFAEDTFAYIPCLSVPEPLRLEMYRLSKMPRYGNVFNRLKALSSSGVFNAYAFLRHTQFTLEENVAALESQLHFSSWPTETVALSKVKGLQRILYRSSAISVAQTMDPGTRSIRETEVIAKRDDGSENFDFYAYDKDGKLATHSQFKTSHGKDTVGSVPYTCMSCHYDTKTRTFQKLPKSFHP